MMLVRVFLCGQEGVLGSLFGKSDEWPRVPKYIMCTNVPNARIGMVLGLEIIVFGYMDLHRLFGILLGPCGSLMLPLWVPKG